MPDSMDHRRREILGAAALALAAGEFVLSESANARPIAAPVKAGTLTSFGPLKQIADKF